MAGYKSEKVRKRNLKVKELIGRLTDNQTEEAHNMGLSTSALHQKINPIEERYNITLAEASLHSEITKIAEWFCEKAGLCAVDPEVNPNNLNGTLDDELLSMVAAIGGIIELLNTSNGDRAVSMAKDRLMELKNLVFQAEQELRNK